MSFGVTPEGFFRKPLAQILSDLEIGWNVIFGGGVDMGPDTPDGQILGLFSGALDEVWQLSEDVYEAGRVSGASGASLSDLVVLNGINRDEGSRSGTRVTLTTSGPDVQITPAFRMRSDEGFEFQPLGVGDGSFLAATVSNGGTLDLESVEVDAIPATDGNVSEIVTPIQNLVSGTNAGYGGSTVGELGETDGTLRQRQTLSTEIASTNILEALYGALYAIAGVIDVRVYVNDTNGTVAGRPPHSYEVVIEGGIDADVAVAIWENHPAGITFHGTTTEPVTPFGGGPDVDVKFTRPTYVDILVEVTVTATVDYPPTGDDDMKTAILVYAAGGLAGFLDEQFEIGRDVALSRIYNPVNSIPGHTVVTLEIDETPGPVGPADVVIDETEKARFTLGNITVTS